MAEFNVKIIIPDFTGTQPLNESEFITWEYENAHTIPSGQSVTDVYLEVLGHHPKLIATITTDGSSDQLNNTTYSVEKMRRWLRLPYNEHMSLRIIAEIRKVEPLTPRSENILVSTVISEPVGFTIKDPLYEAPIPCDPHDIPISPDRGSKQFTPIVDGCIVEEVDPHNLWNTLLQKYAVWFQDGVGKCSTTYKIYAPYDADYKLRYSVDNIGTFTLSEGTNNSIGVPIWSGSHYDWNTFGVEKRHLDKGYYYLKVDALNSPLHEDETLKRLIVERDFYIRLRTDKQTQLDAFPVPDDPNRDPDKFKKDTLIASIKSYTLHINELQKLIDGYETRSDSTPVTVDNPAAFAVDFRTINGKIFINDAKIGNCYEDNMDIFNTRTKLITSVTPKDKIVYFTSDANNNSVRFEWKLPGDLQLDTEKVPDKYSIYLSIFSGSIGNTSFATKHYKLDPISSSFDFDPAWDGINTADKHDFKINKTYTWRVALHDNYTKDLIAVSYPQEFTTEPNDFKPRQSGPIVTPSEFLNFKYDNEDQILTSDGDYYFRTINGVETRVLSIDSDFYPDVKEVKFNLNTSMSYYRNSLYDIASRINEETFTRPGEDSITTGEQYNGNFKDLTPFIKSSVLTIYSKKVIDVNDDSVEKFKEAEIVLADNGKPFDVLESFKFESHKKYYLTFKNKVYYYNDSISVNELEKDDYYSDEFIEESIVEFKKNSGIQNFRTPENIYVLSSAHGTTFPNEPLKTWGRSGSAFYSLSNGGSVLEKDGPLRILAIGESGYTLNNAFYNDIDITSIFLPTGQEGSFYTILNNVTESITVSTDFKPIKLDVSISSERYITGSLSIPNVGGTVTPFGNLQVDKTSTFTFNVFPDDGYVIKEVLNNDVPINFYYRNRKISDNKIGVFDFSTGVGFIENLTIDSNIKVIFQKKPIIRLRADGNGTIVPSGSFEVEIGSDFKFNIIPDVGNVIKNVYYYFQNEDGTTAAIPQGGILSGSFINLQKDYAVVADFSTISIDDTIEEPPNYRATNDKCSVCHSCTFADGDFCTKYKFTFTPDNVCDSYGQKGVIQKNLITDGNEYLLDGEPYYGKYYLWAPNAEASYQAYAGECMGSGKRQKLDKNEGKFCFLLPDFSKVPLKLSTDTANNYYSISTISTASVSDELKSRTAIDNRIELNVDYSDFTNFVVFSSAYDRILNFRDKLDQIESLNFKISNINSLGTITDAKVSQSLININEQKSQVIITLDDFEKYLYFESGSVIWKDYVTTLSGSNYINPWPKANTNRPYTLYSTTSSIATTYLTELFQSASDYDTQNFNSLKNRAPEYFRDEGVLEFGGYNRMLSMFGQYFDFLYLYAKEIANRKFTNLNEKTNVPNAIVPYLLDYFNLFSKSKKMESNISEFLLKINTVSSESVSYLSGSTQDYTSELYLRLLNTAPYVIKSRGTRKAVRSIMNAFGVSDEYIQIKEHGRNEVDFNGESLETRIQKENVNRYYLEFKGGQNVRTRWNTSDVADSIQLKFKSNNNTGLYTTQVLLEGNSTVSGSWGISLISTGSTYGTASGKVKFVLTGSISCSTVELPIFNDIPWTILLQRDTSASPSFTFTVTAKQFYFDNINFSSTGSVSSTVDIQKNTYSASGSLYLGGKSTSVTSPSILGSPFYGRMAEFRSWNILISDSVNNKFVKASSFYGGTSVSSSFTNLTTWLRLDQDIDHNLTSSVNDYNLATTKNHGVATNFSAPGDGSNYIHNWEEEQIELKHIDTHTYSDDKIKIVTGSLISDNTLSPTDRKEKSSEKLYGRDSNKLSIEISTAGFINDDLIKSVDFDLYDYIGDSRFINSSSYDDLTATRNIYLSKYPSGSVNPFVIFNQTNGYDYALIETIKKTVPFKADLQVGFRVEQTALERFKNKTFPSTKGTRNDKSASINLHDDNTLINSRKTDFIFNTIPPWEIGLDKSAVQESLMSGITIDVISNIYSAKSDFVASTVSALEYSLVKSVYNQHAVDIENIYDFDKAVGKTDKYKIVCGSAADIVGSGTPLTRVKGFSTYITSSVLPRSEFTTYYTKSGNDYVLAYDGATEPVWGIENGILTTRYTSSHVNLGRDLHYRNIFTKGSPQTLICDFDNKKVVEITRTTSKAAIVYDTTDDDIILRAE